MEIEDIDRKQSKENPCKDCYAKWVGGCADCKCISFP